MSLFRILAGIALVFSAAFAQAQYGTPESLKAELKEGDDLVYAAKPEPLGDVASLGNRLFVTDLKEGERRPALIVFHTCGGIREHIRTWADAALQAGYVVLVPDAMRGLRADCGSPPQIPNARMVKDGLDAVAHLAALPFVDPARISIVGFSKGAFVATWMASPAVAEALRPGTPSVAAAVAVYGFCSLAPTRARPQGARVLQADTRRPLLMLLGGKDLETPPQSCLEMLPGLKQAGAPIHWHLYPEATHCWDCAESNGFSKVAYNGVRVTYVYDKEATDDTRRRIFEFLSAAGKRGQ